MKTFVIARREFLGTRNLWIGAAFAGMFSWAAPWILGHDVRSDTQLVLVLSAAFGLTLAYGLLLGAGMFGSDLSHHRAGFFLDRPVGSTSLFFGKLSGSLLVVVLAGMMALMPLLALRADLTGAAWFLPASVVLVALASILIGHAGSIILRARSSWLVLDLVAVAVFAALVWTAQASLLRAEAMPAFGWTGRALVACTLLVLLLAGLMQVSIGRTDLGAGHRALSLTMACGLLVAGVGAWLFAWKVLHPTAADLRKAQVQATQPGGNWMLLTGTSVGSTRTWNLLVDSATGKQLRLESEYGGRFSRDGRWFLWVAGEAGKGTLGELRVADLNTKPPTIRDTGILLGGGGWLTAVSGNASQVIIHRANGRPDELGSAMEVCDVQSGKRIDRWTIPEKARTWFHESGQIHSLVLQGSRLQFQVWTPGLREPTVFWGREWRSTDLPWTRVNPAGDRLLLAKWTTGTEPEFLELVATPAGQVLARFEGQGAKLSARFLSTGVLLVLKTWPTQLEFSRVDSSGQILARYSHPLYNLTAETHLRAQVLGELAPGRVLVRLGNGKDRVKLGFELDVRTGTVTPAPEGAGEWFQHHVPDLGGLWSRLHRGKDGSLHLRQPDGSLKRLTAPG